MRVLDLDDIASIEMAMEAKRRHLRDSVSEIARRSRPEHLVSVAGERLGARTTEVLDGAKARLRGSTGYWASLVLGAAGVFELGRWSSSRAKGKASAAVSGVDGEPTTETETPKPGAASAAPVSFNLRAFLGTAALTAVGLAGGFVVSAFAPRLPGEAEATRLVSEGWRRSLSSALGSNGSGLVRLLLNHTGLSRHAATAMMIVSIGELLFQPRHAAGAQRPDGP